MHAKFCAVVVATVLVGCGTVMKNASKPMGLIASHAVAPPPARAEALLPPAPTGSLPQPDAVDVSTLPEAPWSGTPVVVREGRDTAAPLLASLERADNRVGCAPLVPVAVLESADGSHARASTEEGGWSVEFDRAGAPGFQRDGTACEHCGRGAFGVAGIPADGASAQALSVPTFRDGSRSDSSVNPQEHLAVATITVPGQTCTYQVWSFLGASHLHQLVSALRRIESAPAQ